MKVLIKGGRTDDALHRTVLCWAGEITETPQDADGIICLIDEMEPADWYDVGYVSVRGPEVLLLGGCACHIPNHARYFPWYTRVHRDTDWWTGHVALFVGEWDRRSDA